ncbi:MAG: hypothetical protein IJX47_02580, partial [Clostridia bacterium]|nr:hypothetical protein [Clostridia bacterium]
MKGLKNLLFYAVLLIGAIFLLYMFTGNGGEELQYSQLVDYFRNIGTDKEAIKEFQLESDNTLTFVTTANKKYSYIIQDRDIFLEDCYSYVVDYNERANEDAEDDIQPMTYDIVEPTVIPWWVSILPYVAIGGILIFVFIYAMREAGGGKGSKINSFGKSRAKINTPDAKNKVLFSD